MEHYPITGAVGRNPHPRKDIRDLPKDPLEWNLLLGALARLQSEKEDALHPLGYYQVAGIHGAPFIHWMEEPEAEDRPGNYCTHGSALFLTWHRPYLLLLEQLLVHEALDITEGFSAKNREKYQPVAMRLRIPYWDWASDSKIPELVRNPKTMIILPEAGSDADPVPREVNNPWYSYRYRHDLRRKRDFSILGIKEFVRFDETKRCPDKGGNSRPDVADKQIQGPSGRASLPTDYRDGVYKLLTSVASYAAFSNTHNHGDRLAVNHISIENYHNTIHNFIGTEFGVKGEDRVFGHMTVPGISAFDPIFWLHHSSLDRYYALWQAIHFKSDFVDQKSELTRLHFGGRTDDPRTALRPFYHKKDKPWTNNMVQKSSQDPGPTVFDYNYYYPELNPDLRDPEKREKMAVHVRGKVQELYGPKSDSPSFFKTMPEDLAPYLPPIGGTEHSNFRREWMVFLTVKKYLIAENFSIFFFFGEPPEEPSEWVGSPKRVGVFTTFKSSTDICSNCLNQAEADEEMTGGADITNYLYNALEATGIVPDLRDQPAVESWLKDNLNWGIRKDDGTKYDYPETTEASDSLRIGVASFVMAYPTDSSPEYMRKYLGVPIVDHQIHPGVTAPKRRYGGLYAADIAVL